MWGDDQLAKAETKLAQGNQRAAFDAFEMAFNNPHQVQGGYETILRTGRLLRPSVDTNWAARWDRILDLLEARAQQAIAQPGSGGSAASSSSTSTAVIPASESTAHPAARTVTRQPYEWATPLVWVFLAFAALSVIGGFVEASNHSHMVMQSDMFGGRHRASENDWNYAIAGAVAAMFWLGVAGAFALLLGIARDVRRQADAMAASDADQPSPSLP